MQIALKELTKKEDILRDLSYVQFAKTLLCTLFAQDCDSKYDPRHITLLNYIPEGLQAPTSWVEPTHIRFDLHYLPNFTHKQQVQFLCSLFERIPFPFQLLRCTSTTTNEEVQLFFERIVLFPWHKYVILNTNLLLSDIQEVKKTIKKKGAYIYIFFFTVFF